MVFLTIFGKITVNIFWIDLDIVENSKKPAKIEIQKIRFYFHFIHLLHKIMEAKTIVITGASGLLGRAIFSMFLGTAGKVVGTAFSR